MNCTCELYVFILILKFLKNHFHSRTNCTHCHKRDHSNDQTQLCTKNLPEKQVHAKSDLSKQIGETAKKCLGVNIEGKDVFESIISRPASPPPASFVFSSTLVEEKKVPLKASAVLNKVTSPLATSFNSAKSTKNPSLGSQRKSSKLSP